MRAQRKMVLCIDDNIEVLKSLRSQLRQSLMSDVRILLAEGSEDALKTLEVINLSHTDMLLIVSDWLMPNLNGEELIKLIEERWGPIMTIVLSGHITPESKSRLNELNQVLSVMSKPWNGEDLIQLIKGSFISKSDPESHSPLSEGNLI